MPAPPPPVTPIPGPVGAPGGPNGDGLPDSITRPYLGGRRRWPKPTMTRLSVGLMVTVRADPVSDRRTSGARVNAVVHSKATRMTEWWWCSIEPDSDRDADAAERAADRESFYERHNARAKARLRSPSMLSVTILALRMGSAIRWVNRRLQGL